MAIFAQENKLFPPGKPDSCSGRAQPHFVLDPTLKMLKTKLCRCFLKLGKTKQLAIENRFFLLGDEHTVKLKLYILREREKLAIENWRKWKGTAQNKDNNNKS